MTPAVSVIIPLYNTEKYIGECLESILAQTLQNIEVVVVDDCSTDSSYAIAESFLKKFGGRMKLLQMPENSGCAPFPRNKGLENSCGEYVFFMDADDMITQTALEEMYNLAKEYDADVVHCENRYDVDADGSNIRLVNQQRRSINKPTFHSERLTERVDFILRTEIFGVPWAKLVRRDLLMENGIRFKRVRPCDDYLWSLENFFFAKKYLRVPNATYLYRRTETSATRGRRTLEQNISLWLETAILGIKELDEDLDKIDFFKTNLQARYDILNHLLKKMFGLSWKFRVNLQSSVIYDAVKKSFSAALGRQDVLVATLCALVDTREKELVRNRDRIKQLEMELNKIKSELKINELEAELDRLKGNIKI
ncbi:MAG: glycosyltransferase family 2 protein [Selenomonadaceae bacterium]|nr:glycosyltransferase family 2 protein [Selenomonadaceae bacterium]